MQIIFAPKDKLNCTMKKCTVSMATVNVILEDGGVHTSQCRMGQKVVPWEFHDDL